MIPVPVFFAPDIDTSWSVSPGALAEMSGFAPLQLGAYGSVAHANYFASTLSAASKWTSAYMFRKVDNSVRFLLFSKVGEIHDCDSSGTLTDHSLTSPVTTGSDWFAAAWGNQIIAVDGLNVTCSSTSGQFTALSGAPKAKRIAANLNFVMLADVDDGGSNVYSDMVWWSALQNPASWTPSLATQAGNIRLLDAPGPIRQLVAYRDTFIAFKDNAMFVGEYVGPQQFIFQWRLVSAKVGLISPRAVTELDGKLYFLHSSGFYEFDGQTLRNVGLPVFQSFLNEAGYLTSVYGDRVVNGLGATAESPLSSHAVSDDLEGVVWWKLGIDTAAASHDEFDSMVMYGYNARSQKWGRALLTMPSGGGLTAPIFVKASTSDVQTFKAATTARFLFIDNSGTTTPSVRTVGYPLANTEAPYVRTGVMGTNAKSQPLSRVHYRTLAGTDDDSGIAVVATGYTSENKNKTNGTKTLSYNSEFDAADGVLSSRFQTHKATWSTAKKVILAGMSPEYVGESHR